MGPYLAARATVRKAFAMGKATDPYSGDIASYDDATMRRAQQMLESLLAQPNPTPSRAIIQSELNFIRIRTEPEKRAAEISAALAGPAPDPNFSQDLQDLSWILYQANQDPESSAAYGMDRGLARFRHRRPRPSPPGSKTTLCHGSSWLW